MKAIWKDQVIAESNNTKIVESNHYFPSDSVNKDKLVYSDTHTVCPWKGTASYYHIKVNGEINQDAAWYYPDPKDAAKEIKNRIAFWKGVTVTD